MDSSTNTMLIDNDGIHGAINLCKTVTLQAGTYQAKVFALNKPQTPTPNPTQHWGEGGHPRPVS